MDRRNFFKFLRDGGAALAAAVTIGIPKTDDIALVPTKHHNKYDPGSFNKLPVDHFLKTGEWIDGFTDYTGFKYPEPLDLPEEDFIKSTFDHGKEVIEKGWPYKIDGDALIWTELDHEFGNDITYMEKIDYARWHPKQPNKLYVFDGKRIKWDRLFTGIDYLFET